MEEKKLGVNGMSVTADVEKGLDREDGETMDVTEQEEVLTIDGNTRPPEELTHDSEGNPIKGVRETEKGKEEELDR